MVIADAIFSTVRLCSYTIRRTSYAVKSAFLWLVHTGDKMLLGRATMSPGNNMSPWQKFVDGDKLSPRRHIFAVPRRHVVARPATFCRQYGRDFGDSYTLLVVHTAPKWPNWQNTPHVHVYRRRRRLFIANLLVVLSSYDESLHVNADFNSYRRVRINYWTFVLQ